MPNIEVKAADGKVLCTYDIVADVDGILITEEHLFDHARRNTIEDELVSEDEADQLTFRMIEE